jgi:hypothetical protein
MGEQLRGSNGWEELDYIVLLHSFPKEAGTVYEIINQSINQSINHYLVGDIIP